MVPSSPPIRLAPLPPPPLVVQMANKSAYLMFGYTKVSDLIGKNVNLLIPVSRGPHDTAGRVDTAGGGDSTSITVTAGYYMVGHPAHPGERQSPAMCATL